MVTTSTTPWSEHRNVDGMHICKPAIGSIRDAITFAMLAPFDSRQRTQFQSWCRNHYHWEHVASRYADLYAELTESAELCLPS